MTHCRQAEYKLARFKRARSKAGLSDQACVSKGLVCADVSVGFGYNVYRGVSGAHWFSALLQRLLHLGFGMRGAATAGTWFQQRGACTLSSWGSCSGAVCARAHASECGVGSLWLGYRCVSGLYVWLCILGVEAVQAHLYSRKVRMCSKTHTASSSCLHLRSDEPCGCHLHCQARLQSTKQPLLYHCCITSSLVCLCTQACCVSRGTALCVVGCGLVWVG